MEPLEGDFVGFGFRDCNRGGIESVGEPLGQAPMLRDNRLEPGAEQVLEVLAQVDEAV